MPSVTPGRGGDEGDGQKDRPGGVSSGSGLNSGHSVHSVPRAPEWEGECETPIEPTFDHSVHSVQHKHTHPVITPHSSNSPPPDFSNATPRDGMDTMAT